MNTTFNIERIALLLKRFFIESKQRELTFWAISIFVFSFLIGAQAATLYLIIGGFIFAARTFKAFAYTPGGMHYLLIPATHAEKLASAFILNSVYFFAMMLITSSIGNLIGYGLWTTISEAFPSWPMMKPTLKWNSFDTDLGILFLRFLVMQSIFTLGSLIFKKSAAGKTILSMAAFFIVLFIIELIILKITFGTVNINSQTMGIEMGLQTYELFKNVETALKIFGLLLIPYFWTISYFRLTEKQV